jgi:toxin ParE1/3/4
VSGDGPVIFQVRIRARAMKEIGEIDKYVRQRSPSGADNLLDNLVEAIESLDQFPTRYAVIGADGRIAGVRSMPVGNYLVYYEVDDVRRAVDVLVVRHGARRPPRRFS